MVPSNQSLNLTWSTLPSHPWQSPEDCITCDIDFWEVSPDDWIIKPTWEVALKVSVLFLVCFIGILGNLSIIIIMINNKILLLNRTNLLLWNMCASDCLNLIFNPLLYLFKQNVIFRFYYLGDFICNVTPFLIVTFMLASVLSLTTISVVRFLGIHFSSKGEFRLSNAVVYLLIGIIWVIALSAAIPTIIFRRYWTRQWSNLIETNCDDQGESSDLIRIYWLALLGLLVWIPTIVMVVCYFLIFKQLNASKNKFPYMSAQSRVARSRQKVIQTLVFLLVVQIISWFPWQFFTLYDAFVLYLNNGSFDADSVYTHIIGPILYDVKYYFVFTGSALNPILYGYRSDTMRKAFKLTFPCFFKKKANFVIVRGNKGNQATALFRRVDIKMNSMVGKTIIHEGVMGLAPIMAHGVMTSGYNKPKSLVGRDAFFHERNKRSWPKRMNITKSYSTGQIADRVVSMDFGAPKADQGNLFYKMPITPEPAKKSSALNQAAQGLLTIPKKIKRRISVTAPKPQGSPILDMMRIGSSQGPTASSSFEDITKDTVLTPANSISRDMSDNDKVMDEDKKMEFNLERLQQMLYDLKLREMTKSMLTYRPSGRRYTK
ncbi:hypothetical protein TCAL_10176 [Tigriopus californicus]|uniref:G-protein coupled receptors family 1 profile domain-containing protein n=1 Tax=Tigriopus californicus TaxID=6832 RepID=A0A553PRL5_TIGCA|nr:chemerin-like receptor 1 [Tigriopus californicus]TRY80329.1 hypothetical protein TCAL_10176 [Tigriopus californicus]|eukprot:TCALIF_10176-PA protein Name:"Similar to TACR2 Substance-K receptor (Canis familiaris)" AED:0.04 eAED:0.05 QI:0/0.85/0.75/1/0.85/0.87/8/18/601